MKKLFTLIIAALMILPGTIDAQDKMIKKEIAAKKKEYAKGGWQLFGTSRSIDMTLYNHYTKLNEGYEEIIGSAPHFESKNVGHMQAFANAANLYAQRMSSKIEGFLKSNVASDGKNTENEIDQFMASFKSQFEKTLKGELKESYSLIREVKPGVSEMMSFYIIDPGAAAKARNQAIEDLAKENILAKRYAVDLKNL